MLNQFLTETVLLALLSIPPGTSNGRCYVTEPTETNGYVRETFYRSANSLLFDTRSIISIKCLTKYGSRCSKYILSPRT